MGLPITGHIGWGTFSVWGRDKGRALLEMKPTQLKLYRDREMEIQGQGVEGDRFQMIRFEHLDLVVPENNHCP